jgi:hypothetical protein
MMVPRPMARARVRGITDDGRYVVFESIASNLVALDTNQVADVFLRDREAGTTARASVSSTGVQSDRASSFPSGTVADRHRNETVPERAASGTASPAGVVVDG